MKFSKWLYVVMLIGINAISSSIYSSDVNSPETSSSPWCVSHIKQTAHLACCRCRLIKGLIPRTKMLHKINAIESKGIKCCKCSTGKCECLLSIYQELNDITEACSMN